MTWRLRTNTAPCIHWRSSGKQLQIAQHQASKQVNVHCVAITNSLLESLFMQKNQKFTLFQKFAMTQKFLGLSQWAYYAGIIFRIAGYKFDAGTIGHLQDQ